MGSIPGSGRSPGEENGYPLQCSWLENSMDRGTWQGTIHGVAESGTNEQLTLSTLQFRREMASEMGFKCGRTLTDPYERGV